MDEIEKAEMKRDFKRLGLSNFEMEVVEVMLQIERLRGKQEGVKMQIDLCGKTTKKGG